MSVFDQRYQQVNTQINVAGDINFAALQDRVQVIKALEQLQAQARQAAAAGIFDEETATDVEYHLAKAVQQARKSQPDGRLIVDYLSRARELAAVAQEADSLVGAMNQAIPAVQGFFF